MVEGTRIRKWLIAVGLLALTIWAVVALLLLRPALQDPARFFDARRSARFDVRIDTTWAEGTSMVRDLRILGESGDGAPGVEFRAFLSVPAGEEGPHTAFILAAGYRTGRQAIRFIGQRPELASRAIFLTLDYPYDGPLSFRGLEIVPWLPRIRTALFDGVEAIRLAIDFLQSDPACDPDRIVLLGASFGAFYATDAGSIDDRAAAVVTFMGGAGLAGLFDWNLRQGGYIRSRWVSAPLGRLLALLLGPLEPARLAGRIAPRPYVQVSARHDDRIPLEYAERLYDAASEPKRIVWMETAHVLPHLDDIVEEMIGIALIEVARLGLIEK